MLELLRTPISGKRLLKIQSVSPGSAVMTISCGPNEVVSRWEHVPGITCTPVELDGEQDGELVLSGSGLAAASLVDFPRVQIELSQPYSSAVVCGLASIPARVTELGNVVEALLPQVDHMFIYLNNYEDVPSFLEVDRITVFRSQDFGDYRDNSKYFGLRCFDTDAYFLSVDDDIHYPTDYVASIVAAIERYGRQAVVGVHGSLYGAGSRLFLDRGVVHFGDALEVDLPVSALGTGTCGFHTTLLRPESLTFERVGMADLVLARICADSDVPQLALTRPENWLVPQRTTAAEQNLFTESVALDSPHDLYVRAGNVPAPRRILRALEARPYVFEALSSPAKSLLAYLVALEEGLPFDCISIPYSRPLADLANSLRWPSLMLAMANGVAQREWALKRKFRSAILPIRGGALGVPLAHLENLMRHVDVLMGELVCLDAPVPEFPDRFAALEFVEAAARERGDERLTIMASVMRFLQDGGERHLLHLYTVLRRASLPLICEGLGESLRVLSRESDLEILYEDSADLIRNGSVDNVLERSGELLKAGQLGEQLVATAGLLAGKAWVEEMALSLFSKARNARQVRRARDLAKVLRKVPLTNCDPEFWADAMPEMEQEIRQLAATVLLANQVWSERISLDDLDLHGVVEKILWRAAAGASRGLSVRDVERAVNTVFLAGGLSPVEAATGGSQSFFESLLAKPLPPRRDDSAPLVSVVMAVYNGQETIEYSLKSVAAQTYPNLEIIVIDDCSPVPLILPEWARQRLDVKLRRIETNVGPYECRNIAIALSAGEFIATHDADDWMHPQKIERQVRTLSQSNAVASYTRHVRLLKSGAPALENNGKFIGDGPITSMFRRPLFEALGGFMKVRTRGDMEFKSRVVARYRKTRVHHDDAVTLLALDSVNSNSKVFMKSSADEMSVARFKRWYTAEHPVSYFRRQPQSPAGCGRLFDIAEAACF